MILPGMFVGYLISFMFVPKVLWFDYWAAPTLFIGAVIEYLLRLRRHVSHA